MFYKFFNLNSQLLVLTLLKSQGCIKFRIFPIDTNGGFCLFYIRHSRQVPFYLGVFLLSFSLYKSSSLCRMQGTNTKPFMQSKTAWKVVSTPDSPAVWQQGDRGGEEMWTRGWHFQNPSHLPHFQWKLQGILLPTLSKQKCHRWQQVAFPTCSNKQPWGNYLC